MSEGILAEVLDFVRQDKKSYEVMQNTAHEMGTTVSMTSATEHSRRCRK